MKEALWGYWLIILGIFIIVVLLLVQSFTSTNTQDYYLVKTITEASMEDAIDWSYYRIYGEVKINKEKFYEAFLRRFAEEASLATTYTIEFADVYEAPPKVGVKVSSKSSTFNVAGDSTTFDIVNKIDAILESRQSVSSADDSGDNTWSLGGGEVGSSSVGGTNSQVTPAPATLSTYPASGSTSLTVPQGGTTPAEVDLKNIGINLGGKTEAELIAIAGVLNVPYTKNTSEEVSSVANALYNKIKDLPKAQQDAIVDLLSKNYELKSSDYIKTMANQLNGYLTGQAVVEEVTNEADAECLKNIGSLDLKNMRGVSLVGSGKAAQIYDTYADISANKSSRKVAQDGTTFKINGSAYVGQTEYWSIQYNGKCGWVNSDYMAISARDYIKTGIEFNITNYSGSIYKVLEKSIDGVTGKRLYTSEYNDFVPIAYLFAQKVKVAAQNAAAGGDTLVIYDAYRPYKVTQEVGKYFNKIDLSKAVGQYSAGMFFASGVSKHNTGCAVDVSLKGATMPTTIHELSYKSAKYDAKKAKAAAGSGDGTWFRADYGELEKAKTLYNTENGMDKNVSAQKLHQYFHIPGVRDLASEWWHYEMTACHSTITSSASSGASFWSAV